MVATSLPRVPGPEVDGGDKLAHFAAYGLLGLLLARALQLTGAPTPVRLVLLVLVAGGLYAAVDELHQIALPGRTASLGDWVADLVGLGVGAAARIPWRVLRAAAVQPTAYCDDEGENTDGGSATP